MNSETPQNFSTKQPARTPRIFRIVLRLLISIIILFVLLIGAGFVIGYYYQDEVKEYIVNELNLQLNTQVIAAGKDIDFTVVKSFPYGSLNFKNVKALDAGLNKNKDTLFKAGEISLQFNVIDIFKKNYHIKKLIISDVDLHVKVDEQGNDNFHFWKKSSDTSTASFSFALEKIVLKRIKISFKNYRTKQLVDGEIKGAQISGDFSNDKYSLKAGAELFVNTIKSSGQNYLRKKNIHTDFLLSIDNKINTYKIESGRLQIEDLLFEAAGNVISAGSETIINIGVKGKDMDIKSVLSLIPQQFKEKIKDYESDGEFYFNALIRGSFSNDNVPQITADFGMRSANITEVKNNITLKKIMLKGRYSNGSRTASSFLELSEFSAAINEGAISGELKMKDLNNPSFSGAIKANTTLQEIQKLIKADTIESINGSVKINASFSCDGKSASANSYENIITSGDLVITNAAIKLKNNKLDFNHISGSFKFDNNDLAVNDFSGKVSGSDFELKGFFRNIVGFCLKENEDITVEAFLKSDNINLNELLANKDEAKKESNYKLKFSEHINADLNAEIKHLQFRKFTASDIHGMIKLKDKKMILDSVTLHTMNGIITASGLIDGSDSAKLIVTCFSEINKINISRMFEEFENFGQSSITNKNIKGIASAKIQFAAVLSPELVIDMDKLYAGIDMSIDNGELNNVESMKSLSRFIEVKELENIHFATLKNQIEIKKQVINIPKMEIRSTALNVTASGTHSFDNDINYKIKLSLNELLSKKAKAAKKQNDEFGEVADDGLGRTNIFIAMTGTVDNPVIKYDSKGAVQNVKQDLKVEKQNLKGILKDEFGLFKKDSALNSKSKISKEDAAKLKINWEEADHKDIPKKELKAPKKKEEDDF